MTDSQNRMQDRLADMMEATRLTAAGRLQDASDLLQRGFVGTGQTGATPERAVPEDAGLSAASARSARPMEALGTRALTRHARP
jgi:hypothetical protein